MSEHDLDIKGLICPMTVIKVLQKVKQIDDGDKLTVLTDAETTTNSVPKEMQKKGHQCAVENIGPGEWKMTIVKGGLTA